MDCIKYSETVNKNDFEDNHIFWTKVYPFQAPNAHAVRGVVKLENWAWKICLVLSSNPDNTELVWPAELRWKLLSVVKNKKSKVIDQKNTKIWNKIDIGKLVWTECIEVLHSDLEKDELVDTDGSITFMWFVQLAVAFSPSTTRETREAISGHFTKESVDTKHAVTVAQEEQSEGAVAAQAQVQMDADAKTGSDSANNGSTDKMAINKVLDILLLACFVPVLFFSGNLWTSLKTLLLLCWNETVACITCFTAAFLVIDYLYKKNSSLIKNMLADEEDAILRKEYVDTLKCGFEKMMKENEDSIQKKNEKIKKKEQEIADRMAKLERKQENQENLDREIGIYTKDIKRLKQEKNKLANKVEGFKNFLQEMETKTKMSRFSSFMVNLIRHKFETAVMPSTLVCLLHKYNHDILTQKDIERVDAKERNKGPSTAAATLLSLLCRYEGWFPCLMKALRDPMVKQSWLADYAESALGLVRDELKRECEKSAENSQGDHQMEFGFQDDMETKKRESLCGNKARHDTFTTLNNFHLELLPKNWQCELLGDLIKAAGHLTVKVESKYISDRRPQGYPLHDLGGLCGLLRIGCGMVWTLKREFSKVDTSVCRCRECMQDKRVRKKLGEFTIVTDRHLIYDEDEAYFTTVTVSFDNGDGNVNDEQLSLMSCRTREDDMDYIEITCVTHDEQVARKLEKDLNQYTKNLNEIEKIRNQETREEMKCIIIFYSHGLKKCIAVGDVTNSKPLRYQALTCPGSTGAPVFVLGDCFERGKYVSTTTHCTYNMASGIGQSCTWRRY